MTNEELRGYLFKMNWEQVMTEEEGCETWSYPQYRRKVDWPEEIYEKYWTQHYWDLDEAVAFQQKIDAHTRPKKQIVYCTHCDGCGWHEGGPTLQTECKNCSGTGLEFEEWITPIYSKRTPYVKPTTTNKGYISDYCI